MVALEAAAETATPAMEPEPGAERAGTAARRAAAGVRRQQRWGYGAPNSALRKTAGCRAAVFGRA